MVVLLIATVAIMVAGSASAETLPLRVKLTVASSSCRFSRIVVAPKMQTTLTRLCSGTPVAHARLPKLPERELTVLRGKSWVIKLQELP